MSNWSRSNADCVGVAVACAVRAIRGKNERKEKMVRAELNAIQTEHNIVRATSIRCNIILKYYGNGCKLFRSGIILILAPKSERKNVYDLDTFFFRLSLGFFQFVHMHKNLSKAI